MEDPFDVKLTPLDNNRSVAVHLELSDDGELELDEVSDVFLDSLQKA